MKKHSLLPLLACTISAGFLSQPAKAAPASDPAAYKLLQSAYQTRQTLPDNFTGLDATVTFIEGTQTATGKFHYREGEKPALEIAGVSDDNINWITHNARSILVHRTAQNFDKADGAHPLQFGESADNASGKLIVHADEPHLSSRVVDGKIAELVRNEGNWWLTISVQKTVPADPGKYLNTDYTVAYHDKNTGELQRVDIFHDTYKHIGKVWLPSSRESISFGKDFIPRQRTLRFSDIKLTLKK
jgi:hypothetical protein